MFFHCDRTARKTQEKLDDTLERQTSWNVGRRSVVVVDERFDDSEATDVIQDSIERNEKEQETKQIWKIDEILVVWDVIPLLSLLFGASNYGIFIIRFDLI